MFLAKMSVAKLSVAKLSYIHGNVQLGCPIWYVIIMYLSQTVY